jgi:hypothetical protein
MKKHVSILALALAAAFTAPAFATLQSTASGAKQDQTDQVLAKKGGGKKGGKSKAPKTPKA